MAWQLAKSQDQNASTLMKKVEGLVELIKNQPQAFSDLIRDQAQTISDLALVLSELSSRIDNLGGILQE